MPNEVVLGIRIQADGSIAVKQIGDVKKATSSLAENSTSTFDVLRAGWVAVTAAAYAGLRTIQAGWALAQNAAGVQEQMASLDALAARYGTTADQITSRISQVSSGLIGQAAATEVAAQSLAKNLSLDQIYQLADAAETLSNITGKTAANSFRELSAAVALGRERAMEGSAGAIDLRNKYGELASMVSEAQRRQWMYNEILQRANELKRQGVGADDSAADKLERFGNVVAEARRQVGNFLLQGVIPLAQGTTWGIQAAQQHEAAIKAAALAAGVFAAGHFLAGSAAVAKFAWGIQNAGFVLQYFATVTLGPMLVNPLTWIIVAVGGLAYLWIRLGKSTTEARLALDQYRASVVAMNAEQKAQELARQKTYIDELTAYIQRQQEVLAKGPSFNLFDDAINAANLDKAQRWKNDAEERVKMLTSQVPGIKPPVDSGYSERLKRLEEMERDYRNRKEMAQTVELDQDLMQLDHWYDEQIITLDKLDADQEHYRALYAAYSAAYDKADYDRTVKFADAELELYRKRQQDRLDLAVAGGQAELNREEQRLAETQKMNDLALKSWQAPESDAIRARAAAERASMEMQLKRLNLKELELTFDGEFAGTQAELTALLAERALLQEQIESSKRVEAYDLDLRRIEIQREIVDLTRQQQNLILQMQSQYARDAVGQMGGEGTKIGQSMMTVAESGTTADRYEADFLKWQTEQDRLVLAMEEAQRNKEERMRLDGENETAILAATEAQKSAIREAYLQYDMMYDMKVQQQKYSTQAAYAQMAMGLVNIAAAFTDGKSKAIFFAQRGIQAAMSIIMGHAAAMAALAPPPLGLGPVFGAPLAAAMKALGYINAAAIMTTSFMGSGGSGGDLYRTSEGFLPWPRRDLPRRHPQRRPNPLPLSTCISITPGTWGRTGMPSQGISRRKFLKHGMTGCGIEPRRSRRQPVSGWHTYGHGHGRRIRRPEHPGPP